MTGRMYEEIRQQPDVLDEILHEGWGSVDAAARNLRKPGFRFVMIAARGTSDNAALYAKYLFEIRLGMPTALASPSAFTLYGCTMDLENVLVIGISQSGESKDVLEVVRKARELGATTLSLTNEETSSLARIANSHLWLRAGSERSVAATKTYTAELLTLYLLVAALDGAEQPEPATAWLPDQVRRILETGWEGVSRYRYAEYMTIISRGYNLATAKEAALKLMETTYVVAEAFSAADFKHGPIAMIGRDFPVIAIASSGKAQPSMSSLVENLGDRGAELVVISDDRTMLDKASAKFAMPDSLPEELSPVLYAIPIQLLAENLARLKGFDPDAPRGLSKVTETW